MLPILGFLFALAAGAAHALEPLPTRVAAGVGLPLAIGMDLEKPTAIELHPDLRVAPALQASFLPISAFSGSLEHVFYTSVSLLARLYFSPDAAGWFAFTGAGGIYIHTDVWVRPLYGRAYAITLPVGVGWRGVWGQFTQFVEAGIDVPLALEAVFAKSYAPPDSGTILHARRVPFTGVVPRVVLHFGYTGGGRE